MKNQIKYFFFLLVLPMIGQEKIDLLDSIQLYVAEQTLLYEASQNLYTSIDGPTLGKFVFKLKNDDNSLNVGYNILELDPEDKDPSLTRKFNLYLGLALKTSQTGTFYQLFTNDDIANNFG